MNEYQTQVRERMLTRKLLLQALYQWEMDNTVLPDIKRQFHQSDEMVRADVKYFDRLLVECTGDKRDEIEQLVEKAISSDSVARVDIVEKSILRIAIYEMLYVAEVDRTVAIAEAIRLARKFGAKESYRFINGALDQIAEPA